jgi:hypothetical protein
MNNAKHFFWGLFLLLAMSSTASAKDWRGIVPLRSTLEDVEKLLGKSTLGVRHFYETEEGRVMFSYQSYGYKYYNVPVGTILSIQIESKKKPLLADMNLDMSKFRQYRTCIGAIGYVNHEEGFEFHVYDGAVSNFSYKPTAADAKQFANPKPNEQKANGS